VIAITFSDMKPYIFFEAAVIGERAFRANGFTIKSFEENGLWLH